MLVVFTHDLCLKHPLISALWGKFSTAGQGTGMSGSQLGISVTQGWREVGLSYSFPGKCQLLLAPQLLQHRRGAWIGTLAKERNTLGVLRWGDGRVRSGWSVLLSSCSQPAYSIF